MRISDWSSDVCSSDLAARRAGEGEEAQGVVEMVPALRFEEYSGERRLLKLSLIERVEDIDARLFGRSGGCGFVRLDGRLVPVANGHHAFSEEIGRAHV